MIETLGAKNKGKTKDGSKDRWGIMVNGQWWNTINAQHGEVIDGLEKGDQIEVSLVERGAYKNVDSIEKVTDVNEDMEKSKPRPSNNKDTSIVRQALAKVAGAEIGGLCPEVQMAIYGEVINDEKLEAGEKASNLIDILTYMTQKFVNDNLDFGLGK